MNRQEKIVKLLIAAAIAIFLASSGCGSKINEPNQPNCEIATPASGSLAVDYEGNSPWSLTADSLKMIPINGDMRGEFRASVGEPSDSGRLVKGVFVGKFKAPIGDSSFVREGNIIYCGTLAFDGREYHLMIDIVKGEDGFVEVAGYKESYWLTDDDKIYFGGMLFFPQ